MSMYSTRVMLEQLEDGEDEVVDVAESRSLGFLRVMQTAGPVDGDVAETLVQAHGAVDGAARVQLAEIEEAVEDRAVLAEVVLLHLRHMLVLRIGVIFDRKST